MSSKPYKKLFFCGIRFDLPGVAKAGPRQHSNGGLEAD
jgi:hypothetical protein